MGHHIKILLLLTALSITVAAKKKGKKYCKKNLPKLDKCLEQGYRPAIFTECKSEGKKMKGKKAKKCAGIEAKFSEKCDSFHCKYNAVSDGKILVHCACSK